VFIQVGDSRFGNPDEYTDEMKPIYGRLSEEREVEVWLDEDSGQMNHRRIKANVVRESLLLS
jgi:hypothetical protein